MSRRPITRNPTGDTQAKQATASRPDQFAWILANAGSGKTTVLVRRILRLLLTGVQPPQILCLTYTEAAAANMKNRLLKELAEWAVQPDDRLSPALEQLTGQRPARAVMARARQLFAVALQSPGGLKIGTIHGFCTGILQIAPIEANVPSRFDVLDETSAQLLLAEALGEVLAAGHRDDELAASVATISEAVTGQDRLMQLIRDAAQRREVFVPSDAPVRTKAQYRKELSERLGLAEDEAAGAIHAAFLARTPPPVTLAAWRDALVGKPQRNDRRIGDGLDDFLAAASPSEAFACWEGMLLKSGDGLPRREQDLLVKATAAELPQVRPALLALAPEAASASERLKAIAIRDESTAIHHVVTLTLQAYAARKLARRKLDFADLIVETRSLVTRVDAGWLLYKLDAQIEHLLVDEAQDTSFVQWDILQALTREFTAGLGTRLADRRPRTVFAVGDEKQSIYSFQGAEPEAFVSSRRHFQREAGQAKVAFAEIRLDESFRSTQDVVTLVDAVFGDPARWQGLSSEPGIGPQKHRSARARDLGCIDLWPLELKEEKPERKAWDAAPEQTAAPAAALARRIATMLADWTKRGCDDLGRPFSPGDVLILLRSRNALFGEIIRALRAARVPVAGVDRLDLMRHLAVQDMVVIGDALLLPQDDLALATCLKTPVFGLDDDDLLRLTENRTGSLIEALRKTTDPRLAAASARFVHWQETVARRGAFGFYADLLGPGGGYRAMVARLGTEAGDALDAWLAAALDHEHSHGPSLAGFLAAMRLADVSLKRDLAEARDEVRVMTVHGAKGLEAPIVILPDSGHFDTRPSSLRLLPQGQSGAATALPAWVRLKEQDVEVTRQALEAERRKAEEEHNRLLYVALTRAEDRLIVAGLDVKGLGDSSWYRRIEAGVAALEDRFSTVPLPDGSGVMWRMSSGERAADTDALVRLDRPEQPPLAEEAWLTTPARAEFQATPPLTASSIMAAADLLPPGEPISARQMAGNPALRERGLLAHLLLQHLPLVPEPQRREAGMQLARHVARHLEEQRIERVVHDMVALIAGPDLAELFGPDSLPELSLAGRICLPGGEEREADGRIDRLVLLPDKVLFVDFKTSPQVPDAVADVPSSVMRQMAIYHSLLEQALPGRAIEARLIYTEGPAILALSESDLRAARHLIAAG